MKLVKGRQVIGNIAMLEESSGQTEKEREGCFLQLSPWELDYGSGSNCLFVCGCGSAWTPPGRTRFPKLRSTDC